MTGSGSSCPSSAGWGLGTAHRSTRRRERSLRALRGGVSTVSVAREGRGRAWAHAPSCALRGCDDGGIRVACTRAPPVHLFHLSWTSERSVRHRRTTSVPASTPRSGALGLPRRGSARPGVNDTGFCPGSTRSSDASGTSHRGPSDTWPTGSTCRPRRPTGLRASTHSSPSRRELPRCCTCATTSPARSRGPTDSANSLRANMGLRELQGTARLGSGLLASGFASVPLLRSSPWRARRLSRAPGDMPRQTRSSRRCARVRCHRLCRERARRQGDRRCVCWSEWDMSIPRASTTTVPTGVIVHCDRCWRGGRRG